MQRFTLRIIAFCFVWSNFESAAIFSFSCWQLNRKTCLQNVKLENARHQLFVGVSGVGCRTSQPQQTTVTEGQRHNCMILKISGTWNFQRKNCLKQRYSIYTCNCKIPTTIFHWRLSAPTNEITTRVMFLPPEIMSNFTKPKILLKFRQSFYRVWMIQLFNWLLLTKI